MILILKMKHGDYPVYARNGAEHARAYLHLFNLMDGHGFYGDLDGDEAVWCEEARQGDAKSARWLLDTRTDWEYEQIREISPVTP